MALPFLTLTLAYLGEYYLLMRSSLLDVMGEEFITLARAKGVREKYVLRRHAVRNALLPTVTLIALSFAFVLGGAITVELVFTYPGGAALYDALVNRTSRCSRARSCSSASPSAREPDRRPDLRLPRPPGADRMTTTEPTLTEAPIVPPEKLTPRRVKWLRRRRALSRFWSSYRSSTMGMVGLFILGFFVLMAIYSASGSAGRPTDRGPLDNPTKAPPAWSSPWARIRTGCPS